MRDSSAAYKCFARALSFQGLGFGVEGILFEGITFSCIFTIRISDGVPGCRV